MAHLTAQPAGPASAQRGPAGEAQVRVAWHAALGVPQDPLGAVYLDHAGRVLRGGAGIRHRGRGGREREVLQAIAGGWTNSEIAQRLNLAESTVKTHVGRVLAKIGARDCVQAVIFAYDTRLVRPA